MGVAALILGILGLIIAVIPFCGVVAFLPCVIGLILGIVEIVTKNKNGQPIGMGIAGTVLNAVAVVCIIGWMFFAAVILANDPEFVEAFDEGMDEALIEMEESDNEFNWD